MAVDDDSRFYSRVRLAQRHTRFVEQFPKSSQARGAAEYAIVHTSAAARYLINYMRATDWLGVPRGIDHDRLRRLYLARTLQLYDDYAARYIDCYDDPKQECGSWVSFHGMMSSYFHAATADLARRNAGQAEIDAAVQRWSERFDSHPAACPHSDFFRLRMASLHNDKAGFLRRLNDVQKRRPDPKDDYWVRGGDIAQNALYHLFRHGTGQCNFWKWRHGQRGIGGLPFDDYDPAKDTSTPTAIELN